MTDGQVKTPSAAEQYYDAHIAPKLLEISKDCRTHGISLIAQCEWEPGETGRTANIQAEAGVGILIAHAAMQAHGNVDSLLMAVIKYAQDHGHNSVYLGMLGVPTEPLVVPTAESQGNPA